MKGKHFLAPRRANRGQELISALKELKVQNVNRSLHRVAVKQVRSTSKVHMTCIFTEDVIVIPNREAHFPENNHSHFQYK